MVMKPDFNKGQHFLTDKKIVIKEIEYAKICEDDKIIEIGSGNGTLTEELVKTKAKIISFEIDKRLEKELKVIQKHNKNLKIIIGNALSHSWKGHNKIVSNIPYVLSEQIIMKSIEEGIDELVLIIGENMKNSLEKDTKIGMIARLFYKIEALEKIDKTKFTPSPRTNSWMIRMTKKNNLDETTKVLRKISMSEGKIKNAIISSFTSIGKTKKESKEMLKKFYLNEQALNKSVKKITPELLKRIEKTTKLIMESSPFNSKVKTIK